MNKKGILFLCIIVFCSQLCIAAKRKKRKKRGTKKKYYINCKIESSISRFKTDPTKDTMGISVHVVSGKKSPKKPPSGKISQICEKLPESPKGFRKEKISEVLKK